jgi:hypothetical protein
MNTYEAIPVAKIVDASGEQIAIVFFNVNSYSVPAIRHTDKRGRTSGVYGCRYDDEAFRLAKRLAKKAGRDTRGWKLVFVPFIRASGRA